MTSRKFIAAALAVLVLAVLIAISWRNVLLRMPDEVIAAYLSQGTPIGSTEAVVMEHTNRSGCNAKGPYRHELAPSPDYPKNSTGGSSWTTCVLGTYGLIFETAVEVFYIFDGNGQLKEISIRKTTNAL